MENEVGLPVVSHLLQYTLRRLCLESEWDYAVFWRILPRNYPPPKWDAEGGASERSRANRRNWILVWEDGFCNFSDCPEQEDNTRSDAPGGSRNTANNTREDDQCVNHGLQPELFFKMSHEVYNYGEGVVGKVAAENSHKWIYRDPQEHVLNFLSPWQNSIDHHPRAWEAQFNSGIQTIALIAVKEGLVQLGSVKKVIEDLNFVILLQRKFNYLQSIPGVLLPHPSSVGVPAPTATPFQQSLNSGWNHGRAAATAASRSLERCFSWNGSTTPECDIRPQRLDLTRPTGHEFNDRISWGSSQHFSNNQQQKLCPRSQCLINYSPNILVMPSMSSLQALLSKLPSVTPQTSSAGRHGSGIAFMGNSPNANSSQCALESAGNHAFPNKVSDLEQRAEDTDGTAIHYSYNE